MGKTINGLGGGCEGEISDGWSLVKSFARAKRVSAFFCLAPLSHSFSIATMARLDLILVQFLDARLRQI